jgi:membrane protein YdbS with pleckstrin-like domain
MISAEEEKFFQYWLKNRGRKRKLSYQLLSGLPWGLLIGAGIVIALYTGGWYERATMEANSQLNAFVLLLAVVCIAVFTGVFYKKHQWEMNEQRYKELLHKRGQ